MAHAPQRVPDRTGASVRPYDLLRAADQGRQTTWLSTLTSGWALPGHAPIPVVAPGPWDHLPTAQRSWVFNVHAWEPLGSLLAEHSRRGNQRCLDAALEFASAWLERHGDAHENTETPAWQGMATGLRAYRLGYMLDVVRDAGIDAPLTATLAQAVRRHARVLADEDRFVRRSNHGIIQAAGQLAMATRLVDEPLMSDLATQAQARLLEVLTAHVSSEGVYLEHSPTYQQSVLQTLAALDAIGLIDDEELRGWIPRLAAGLLPFVRPDGRLVNFGDTDADVRAVPELLTLAPARQDADGSLIQPLPAAGYAIVRGGPSRGNSYLALTAAFHSRVHKHADDLSFVWFDADRDLLIDAGRYGYAGLTDPGSDLRGLGHWYSDPARLYVESTRAHNAIEADGVSSPRRATPYGSALKRWSERDGIALLEARARLGAIVQRRVLVLNPARWLIVIDAVNDPSTTRHTFVQRFHFASGLGVKSHPRGVWATGPDGASLSMTALLDVELVKPVKGQDDPNLLGWHAPGALELSPNWTAAYEIRDANTAVFATLFWLGSGVPVVDERTRVNATARRGQCLWTVGNAKWVVEFDGTDEDAQIGLTVRCEDAGT